MKKFLSLFLALLIAFCFVGCNNTSDEPDTESYYIPELSQISFSSSNSDDEVSFSGKTMVCFGDSIFANGIISSTIAKKTGAKVHNVAFGGCRMSTHDNNYGPFSMYKIANAIVDRNFAAMDANADLADDKRVVPAYFKNNKELLKTIDFNTVDYVLIAFGTNDFTAFKEISQNGSTSVETFDGALRHTINTILKKYPHIKIVLCTPIYRFYMSQDGAFLEDSDTKTNKIGKKLTDYGAAIKKVAAEYDIPVVDNYKVGINKETRNKYFDAGEGLHPNQDGGVVIGNNIADNLKKKEFWETEK